MIATTLNFAVGLASGLIILTPVRTPDLAHMHEANAVAGAVFEAIGRRRDGGSTRPYAAEKPTVFAVRAIRHKGQVQLEAPQQVPRFG